MVGVADHGGWAILVTVTLARGAPVIIDRRRVRLIDDGVPTQPYHHDTRGMEADAAELLIRRVQGSVADCTERAFDELSAALAPRHEVSAVAIRMPTLSHLPASVREAHASYHVMCRADGMLYHAAICTAARARGWPVRTIRRGAELAEAAMVLQTTAAAVDGAIRVVGRALGPPWTADHRFALAAALAATDPGTAASPPH